MPQILDYTLAQFRGFLAAITKREAEQDARLLALITTGVRGDADQIERVLSSLSQTRGAR